MSAAKAAFEAVPYTVDKRGQVWTCIGHLNSAQHAYEKFILSGPLVIITGTRAVRESDANVKRRFTLVLKAVCYKYLNEQSLCEEALTLSETPVERLERDRTILQGVQGVWWIVYVLTGFMIAEVFYMNAKGIGDAREQYKIDAMTFGNLATLLVKRS